MEMPGTEPAYMSCGRGSASLKVNALLVWRWADITIYTNMFSKNENPFELSSLQIFNWWNKK